MTPTENTISIKPASTLIEAAFAHFDIPLGGALSVAEDGTLTCDTDAEDFQRIMSALTGMVLADHATATMVLPSNVTALRRAIDRLRLLPLVADSRESLEEIVEDLGDIAANLDGTANPVRPADR